MVTGGQEDRWRQVDSKIDGDWRKRGQRETGGQDDIGRQSDRNIWGAERTGRQRQNGRQEDIGIRSERVCFVLPILLIRYLFFSGYLNRKVL